MSHSATKNEEDSSFLSNNIEEDLMNFEIDMDRISQTSLRNNNKILTFE